MGGEQNVRTPFYIVSRSQTLAARVWLRETTFYTGTIKASLVLRLLTSFRVLTSREEA